MIRIGIVGAGRNTQEKHIPKLREIDDVQIVSVCNRSRKSSENVASRFGIPKVYDNWQELVAAPDTDAIVIGTWPYMHCPVTLAAFEVDKHVLVEARMAMNLSEGQKMLQAAKQKPKLVAQIVPSPFSFAVDAAIQRLISDGYLGDILAIEVRDQNGQFIDTDSPLHWRQDAALSGVNMMSLGIWYETIMRWVGEANCVMAMGEIYTNMRRHPENDRMTPVTIPEHINVLAGMDCGAKALFTISEFAGLSWEKSATLFGSDGTLRFGGGQLFGGRRGDSTLEEIGIEESEKNIWRVEEEFINAIHGRESIKYTPFDVGVKYMAFTEAVFRSMRERRMVLIGKSDFE